MSPTGRSKRVGEPLYLYCTCRCAPLSPDLWSWRINAETTKLVISPDFSLSVINLFFRAPIYRRIARMYDRAAGTEGIAAMDHSQVTLATVTILVPSPFGKGNMTFETSITEYNRDHISVLLCCLSLPRRYTKTMACNCMFRGTCGGD